MKRELRRGGGGIYLVVLLTVRCYSMELYRYVVINQYAGQRPFFRKSSELGRGSKYWHLCRRFENDLFVYSSYVRKSPYYFYIRISDLRRVDILRYSKEEIL